MMKPLPCVYLLQPVADQPFTFEMELDDLPKERLKEMIYEEIEALMERNKQGKLDIFIGL